MYYHQIKMPKYPPSLYNYPLNYTHENLSDDKKEEIATMVTGGHGGGASSYSIFLIPPFSREIWHFSAGQK